MTHPTDPLQLRRWLVAPRTGQTPAEYACAVESYTKQGVSAINRAIYGGIFIALALVAGVAYFSGG